MKRKLLTKIVACGLSAALCVSMSGGAAFAAGDTAGKGTNWEAPTQIKTNTVTKDGVLYKVLTTWANAWSTSGPDYLGISNSAYYGNGQNGNADAHTLSDAKNSSLIGIWASVANESPNAYNWNTFYNLYAAENNLTPSDLTATDQSEWDSESGVRTPFKYRPEIIWFCNNLNAAQTAQYVGYINAGKYYKSETTDNTDTATVTTDEFSDGTSQVTTTTGSGRDAVSTTEDKGSVTDGYDMTKQEYYVDGDESYAPETIQPNNSNPYSFVESAYELAGLAKKVIAATADYKSTLTEDKVNWKNMNSLPRTNRYTESVDDCALYVEKLARGSMYYALSKINSSDVARKTVAYVAYYPGYTDNRNGISIDDTHAVVAVYDYTENIGSGPMDGRASWSPLTVNQLTGSTVYQEQTGGQSVAGDDVTNRNADTTYTLYTVDADDLAKCDVIYSPQNSSYTADMWKSFIETNASTQALKSKASSITYVASSPSVTNGSNFTMDKLIYGCFAMDCIYPELFPNMMNSTYWYDNVYHLTDEALGTAMQWAFGNASLPADVNLVDLGKNYSKAAADAIYEAGYQYYTSAKDKDATLIRVAANKDLNGNTKHTTSGTEYDNFYGNFAPSDYWVSLHQSSSTTTPSTTTPTVKTGTVTTLSDKSKVKVTSSSTVTYTSAPKKSSVTIPATVKLANGKTYKVTAIASKAFYKNTKVTKVTIGKNIKTIGSSAFSGCTKLKTVKLGASVKTISSNAFKGCKKLTSITITSKVTSIGSSAFSGCTSLKTVKLGASVKTISSNAFKGCKKLSSLTISSKVTKIGSSAFSGCSKLKTLTVKSKKLTKKGVKSALKGSSIKTVKVPKAKKAAYKKIFTKANCGKKVTVK